jgi:D-glycero-D-manno-heptose 1,7-bisphosphate phosphatase
MEMSEKAVFLDRDDTIIEDTGYINSPQQVKLVSGSAGALADLRKIGYKIIVVTNQSGIARGIITEQAIAQIHERLKQLLAEQNVYLDRIYYCPYHPDGVIPKFRRDSELRKPKPGMLLAAAKEMNIDLAGSWMVGNDYRDIAAGYAAGCRTILIKSHIKRIVKQPCEPDADFEAINLKEAVNIMKREIAPVQNIEPAKSPVEEPLIDMEKERQKEIQPVRQAQQETSGFASSFAKAMKDEKAAPDKEEVEVPEQKTQQAASDNPQDRVEQLLEEIKHLLKSRHRDELYSDFSALKLFAGILQIVVLFCLIIALWFWLAPTAKESVVFTILGFAIVIQLIALTLYIMHNEK